MWNLRYRSIYMYILTMGIDPAENCTSKTVSWKNFFGKAKSCYITHNAKIAMFFEDWHGWIITKKIEKFFSQIKSQKTSVYGLGAAF